MTTWTPPAVLSPENEGRAVVHLKKYFHGADYSGNYFERLAGGGDTEDVADRVTPADLLSLAMLSVPVTGAAARSLLEGSVAESASALLREIPNNVALSTPAGRAALTEDGPAAELWRLVRSVRTFGAVRTSKLLARKRPHLIPIYDDVVREQFGASDSRGSWAAWRGFFANPVHVTHLERLRTISSIGDDISLLRVLDVVVWMEGSSERTVETRSPEEEA